jgi:nitrite reductase/ring-hydroxylating ferredoxin subunit
MAAKTKHPTPICSATDVAELGKYGFIIDYRGQRREAVLIRFNGVVYGYLNQCVHMPRTLDCEESHIFDETGRYLQCSMHKICYDPLSGVSMSELCAGKKLTSLKVSEDEGVVYLLEKRAQLLV